LGWIRIDRVTWAERALWVALVAAAIARELAGFLWAEMTA